MPRPNPVQNGGAPSARLNRPAPPKPTKIRVSKLTPAEKAARRGNPHAAALDTARRGGLFLPTTRVDQGGAKTKTGKPKQPRMMLPKGRSIARPAARDAEGDAMAAGRLKADILKAIDTKMQQMLPGAADARSIATSLETLSESITLLREDLDRRDDDHAAEMDAVFEAIGGDKAAIDNIKQAIAARRVAAKERAKRNG